ncbi:MAG: ArsA family ATPase, partial [Gemmatimonadetes bacterium]|nr:ArsA family ATPase [Gemmatimonadota bacterium]NIQ53986.1 ArsA family ATPase [Gemmatimonadota bacterium]NIU74173.1 ArsA family ATPase [Gammaproteobacteria bacterium]NIX44205.1 ArsA family ATPase [Gemmatimonadota bacterium]NIY08435.1 ArsA family ATPase [Gemmatimonadota bacterium]
APTGHTLRLLSLPELMAVWIEGLLARRRKVNALGRMWRNVAGAAAGSAGADRDPVVEVLERRLARFRRAREIVTDPDHTAFAFVVTPERLPIEETRKAVSVLERNGIHVGAVLANRVLPDSATGGFVARRRQRERGYLEEIDALFPDHPVVRIPLLDTDVHGIEA